MNTQQEVTIVSDGDHVVEAVGAPDVVVPVEHKITASAHDGVTITPSGELMVAEGESITFTITAEPGFHIAHIFIDGVDVVNP